jgi:hypothetical protein
LRHLRGVQQSHQSGITQVCKELIAKDLSGKFLPGDRVFLGCCEGKFVITLVTNDLMGLETKMQRGEVNRNRPFWGRKEFNRMSVSAYSVPWLMHMPVLLILAEWLERRSSPCSGAAREAAYSQQLDRAPEADHRQASAHDVRYQERKNRS